MLLTLGGLPLSEPLPGEHAHGGPTVGTWPHTPCTREPHTEDLFSAGVSETLQREASRNAPTAQCTALGLSANSTRCLTQRESGCLGKAPVAGAHHAPGRWTREGTCAHCQGLHCSDPALTITFQPHSAIPNWPERPRCPPLAQCGKAVAQGEPRLVSHLPRGHTNARCQQEALWPSLPAPTGCSRHLFPETSSSRPTTTSFPVGPPKEPGASWPSGFSNRECAGRKKCEECGAHL